MIKAYGSYWKNGLNFNDRTSPGDYWETVLVNVIITIALFVYMYLSTSGAVAGFKNPLAFIGPVAPIAFLVSWPVITLVPSVAMTVRRLHDSGRSGFFYLFALIPLAGMFIMVIFLTSPTKPPHQNRYGYRRQV